MRGLTRSQLAKRCGVNIESLRYYEKRRLIDPPPRSPAGYRMYSEEDALRVHFIRSARKLGFTLNEISELLKLRVQPGGGCESVRKKAQTKLAEVEHKIHGLNSMKRVLKSMIRQCEDAVPTEGCPILDSFESGRGG